MAKRKKSQVTFDDCTAFFPNPEPPENFDDFWAKTIRDLHATALNPKTHLLFKKSLGWEIHYQISFQFNAGKSATGNLVIPRIKRHRPSVLILPDMNQQPPGSRPFTDAGIAHLTLDPTTFNLANFNPQNLSNNNTLFDYYLSAIRAVDFLAQQKGNNPGKIAILGSGIGAAAAAFAAYARPENVAAVVMERPGCLFLNHWFETSINSFAVEVREALTQSAPRVRQKMQEAISLLDPIHIAHSIHTPVFSSCLMTDERHPPKAIFGFFNLLRTEKYMDLYMEESNDPHGLEQRKKSLHFFSEKLTGKDSGLFKNFFSLSPKT